MLSQFVKACGLSLAVALCLSAADPFLGTWKVNLAKSKYDSGRAPQSLTSTYTADGDWIILESKGVNSNGNAISSRNKYKRDGNDYPYKTATIEGLVSNKSVDSHNTSGKIKREGKVVITYQTNVSKDGRVLTMKSSGTNVDGKPFKALAVYDKQ